MKERIKATDARLIETVRNGFLRYFEALAAADVAKASETELADQLRIARVRQRAGVITIADRLRVQVALANAHQQEVEAQAEAEIARTSLLDTIGLDVEDEAIVLEEPTTLLDIAARPVADRPAVARAAVGRRPAVRAAQRGYEAAVATQRSRIFAMLPDVDFEAAYVRVDGQLFAPQNSWYAGIKAQWTFWEWGAAYFTQRSAGHEARAAQLDLRNQERQVLVEVRNAFSHFDAATAAVVAAQQAIDSANEAYRVTTKLVESGAATTTDLLNAQSELTTARLNLTRHRYEQAMARVTLMRLSGQ